jgi:hypothetical protein
MRFQATLCLFAFALGGISAPAHAVYEYTALANIISSDGTFEDRNRRDLGDPPVASIFSPGVGSNGSTSRAEVAPGRITSWTTGVYNTTLAPPEGAPPTPDGFVQARALGFVRDTLTIDADAAGGFLQVAIAYNNSTFQDTNFKASEGAILTAQSLVNYEFSAGAPGAETRFVNYSRLDRIRTLSSGTGFVVDETPFTSLSGNFASGQVFLVPFTTGSTLSISLISDCTGIVEVSDFGLRDGVTGFGSAGAGCGTNQAFGWGGILGAVDANGGSITLRSVTAASSGADYRTNLSGLAFDPNFSVPEPATWAQLLLGFGLIGAIARRRRPVIA